MLDKKYITFVFAALLLFAGNQLLAQNKYKKQRSKNKTISRYRGRVAVGRFRPYYFVGGSVNALNYFGDLAPVNKAASTDISFTRPGLGIFAGYKFHHSMAVRASFLYGRISGDDFSADPNSEGDAPRYYRNLSFRNDIKELSAGLQVFLFPNYGGPNGRPPLNGFLYLGVAAIHHEPKGLVPGADYQSDPSGGIPAPSSDEWVKLRPLETEGEQYSSLQIAIPLTIGADIYLNNNLSAGIEFGIRKLFFDYIDDVSGTYRSLDSFDDPLARIMSDRSAEPNAVLSGDPRNVGTLITARDFGGTTYSSIGTIGAGQDGAVRGNPDSNDLYFVTQLKITYLLQPVSGRRAKFR